MKDLIMYIVLSVSIFIVAEILVFKTWYETVPNIP